MSFFSWYVRGDFISPKIIVYYGIWDPDDDDDTEVQGYRIALCRECIYVTYNVCVDPSRASILYNNPY